MKQKDFTLIEIIKEDEIEINDLFEIDDNCYHIDYDIKQYHEKGIISIGVSKTKEIELPFGLIYYLLDKTDLFLHDCNTEEGFSGGPILLGYNLKIIGIHKGYKEISKKNIGIYMKEIINKLNEENEIHKNVKNSIFNKKEILKNNENDNESNLSSSKNSIQIQEKQDEDEKIDIDYYSRHLCTFGTEIKMKLMKMKVLIVGLRGLGEEIAKNIILIGVKGVQIYDPEIVKINDLGSNFYLRMTDVGKKRRDEATLNQLSQLNSRIKVSIMQGSIIENIKNFNVIIITEIMKKEKIIEIDEFCRNNNIAFIYCSILGLSGFSFVDFGNGHIIYNDNGEENKNHKIEFIEENGAVNLEDSICELSDEHYIKFREVRGMTQLNDGKPRKIKVISSRSFKIEDEELSKYPDYKSGGFVEGVKIPIKKL